MRYMQSPSRIEVDSTSVDPILCEEWLHIQYTLYTLSYFLQKEFSKDLQIDVTMNIIGIISTINKKIMNCNSICSILIITF